LELLFINAEHNTAKYYTGEHIRKLSCIVDNRKKMGGINLCIHMLFCVIGMGILIKFRFDNKGKLNKSQSNRVEGSYGFGNQATTNNNKGQFVIEK